MDFNPEILHRYFKGTYSHSDYKNLKAFWENEPYRPMLKKHLEEHWERYFEESQSGQKVDYLLRKIHRQIKAEEKLQKRVNFINVFQRAAAILIVPFVLAFLSILYLQQKTDSPKLAYAEIQCPFGVRTKFELPDGSSGFLNSGSTLRFPTLFTGQRNVSLSGEAYFNVVSDEAHPFVVKTPNLNVKVLGTEFNVIAYEGDASEEVILNKGRVDVLSAKGDLYCALQPNQSMTFNISSGTMWQKNVEAHQYIGWTEGKLVFRHENMQQVAQRLGRWYNAEVEIQDPEILDYVFRATFVDEPLDEVLKLLTYTAPISYETKLRETTQDNIYKKKKVILKLDKKREAAFK
ncbi:FecR domain-containing protein [Draconibacterium orientale]|uniref:FecR family protein n=1 Tax=Draconibacterium orientale TaxID=1168034 RepID=UPI0029C02E07|nr:FecR domain-containing protein [Draconibacterium orientale]